MTFDAVIIGGGPAGATCGLWLKLLGHAPIVIEARDRLGGVLCDSDYANPWITGMGQVTGAQSAARIHDHLVRAGIDCRCGWRAESVTGGGAGYSTALAGPEGRLSLESRYVVAATGISPVSDGFEHHAGFSVGPGPAVTGADFRGLRVAILGGGDNGYEHYGLVRARGAAAVRLFARSVRAQAHLRAAVPESDCHIGAYDVDPRARMVEGEPFDRILVFYGYEAHTDYLGDLPVGRDQSGYIATNRETAETDSPGLFAAGDLARRGHPCCLTAMADGVAAAKAIASKLDAG